MILVEIKKFFEDKKEASIWDVAKHFNIQPSAAQGMIDFWFKKGVLKQCENACAKKSCGSCSFASGRYQLVA